MADANGLTSQHIADKDLLDCICKAFVLHNTASQKRLIAHTKDRKKLIAHKAVIQTEFCKSRKVIQAKIDRTQASVGGAVARANALTSVRVRLLVSERVLSVNCGCDLRRVNRSKI